MSSASRLANTVFGIAIVATVMWPGTPGLALPAREQCASPETQAVTDDGSPSILGPTAFEPAAVVDWWYSTGRSQPEQLTVAIDDVLAAYMTHGEAEGVRGDWALAQAILETGWFRNEDTAINNFAGIGHRQDRESGYPYPDADTGVRAHIQLLKRFAAGNEVPLMLAEAAPMARAEATTWAQLAGTWASSTEYWITLGKVHARLHSGICMPS